MIRNISGSNEELLRNYEIYLNQSIDDLNDTQKNILYNEKDAHSNFHYHERLCSLLCPYYSHHCDTSQLCFSLNYCAVIYACSTNQNMIYYSKKKGVFLCLLL